MKLLALKAKGWSLNFGNISMDLYHQKFTSSVKYITRHAIKSSLRYKSLSTSKWFCHNCVQKVFLFCWATLFHNIDEIYFLTRICIGLQNKISIFSFIKFPFIVAPVCNEPFCTVNFSEQPHQMSKYST